MLVFPGPIFTPPQGGGASSLAWDPAAKGAGVTLSTTNTSNDTASYGSSNGVVLGTVGKSSGKWYWELVVGSGTVTNGNTGIGKSGSESSAYGGQTAASISTGPIGGGFFNNNTQSGQSATYAANDILCFALDMDNLLFYAQRNATGWFGSAFSANPATQTNGYTIPSSGTWFPMSTCYSSGNSYRFPTTLTYTPPSGFTSLS